MNPDEVRRRWADRTGEYSPAYYAHRGPDGTSEALLEVVGRHVAGDRRVLELGCSSGRHLGHLWANGVGSPWGIEVNGDAFDVMAEAYPGLAAAGTFREGTIEEVVGEFPDDHFGAVYSVETLQHVHPEAEWVFPELARVAGDLLVTVENEGPGRGNDGGRSAGDAADGGSGGSVGVSEVDSADGRVPLYHRNWRGVFADLGWTQVETRDRGRDTLRAFRPAGGS